MYLKLFRLNLSKTAMWRRVWVCRRDGNGAYLFRVCEGLAWTLRFRCCLIECKKLLTANLRNHTEKHSIISRQNQGQILSGSLSSISPDAYASRHAAISLMEAACENRWSNETECRRKESLAAGFDVDGPCMVSTQFNPEWEVCRGLS
jgi:hypothetical protein